MQITSGSTVGIFGQTGSGKSTLLKILSRQYNPTSNAIFVDGTDLTQLDLLLGAEKIAYVPQKSFYFPTPFATTSQCSNKRRTQGSIPL